MLPRPTCAFSLRWLRRLHDIGSSWSLAEALVHPALLLVLTPILLEALGTAGYSRWVFVYSIVGFGGIASLGMPISTQLFVARANGGGRNKDTANILAQTLGVAVVGGTLLGGALFFSAPTLAMLLFNKMGDPAQIVFALRVGGIVIACQQVEAVLGSALRGVERFDLAAKAEVGTKSLVATGAIICAYSLRDINAVLIVTAVGAFGAAATKGLMVQHIMRSSILQIAFRIPDRAILSFGFWNWVLGISGTVFQQADRLVLSAMFGALALANYAIASQIGALVHVGLSAAFAVMLPRVARLLAVNDQATAANAFSRAWRRGVALNFIAVIAFGLPLLLCGSVLLQLWLGPAAEAALEVYPWVLLAFLLVSVNIAPHFLLLASGQARYVSLANGAAGLLATMSLYPAVLLHGSNGAAVSRAIYGGVLAISYFLIKPPAHTANDTISMAGAAKS
jgi:O-antigen/teichoic acid export membrane protein